MKTPFEADTPRALFGDAVETLRELKRTYAGLARTWRPEVHPAEFRHIRRLYEEAIARLERAETIVTHIDTPGASPDAAPHGRDAWSAWEALEAELYARDPRAWAAGLRRVLGQEGWGQPPDAVNQLLDRVSSALRIPDLEADGLCRVACETLAWQAAAADPEVTRLAEQVRAAVSASGAERLSLLAGIEGIPAFERRHPGLAALVYRTVDEVTGRSRALRAADGAAPKVVTRTLRAELNQPRSRVWQAELAQWGQRLSEEIGQLQVKRNLGCLILGCFGAFFLYLLVGEAHVDPKSGITLAIASIVVSGWLCVRSYRAWWDIDAASQRSPPEQISAAGEIEALAAEKAVAIAICRRNGLWIHELAAAVDVAPDAIDALLDDPLSDLAVVGDRHLERIDLGGSP